MRYSKCVVYLFLLFSLNAYAQGGEAVYQQTCIACHGEEGKGVMPGVPDFTEKNSRLTRSDEALMKSMRDGMQSKGSPMAMPAKGGNSNLTEDDLKNVLNYMRSKF